MGDVREPARQRQPTRRRVRNLRGEVPAMRWPRRIGASLFLVFLLTGPPLLLARTVGWPLRRWPSPQQARQWLEQPLTEQTLTGALAILAWLVWLLLAGTLLVRLVARTRTGMRWLRRVPLPTPLQATATGMAGAAVFSASASTTPTPPADIPSTTVGTADHHTTTTRTAETRGTTVTIDPDGVTVPGGWIPHASAEQVAAAAALVWLRRRRAYRPDEAGPAQRDNLDLAPLPETVTATHAALAASDGTGPSDLTAPNQRTEQPPDSLLADVPPAGVGLTGVAADDAARGVLVTVLLRALHQRSAGTALITTIGDLTRLLGPSAQRIHSVSGLTVAASLQEAVTVLEEHPHHQTPDTTTGQGSSSANCPSRQPPRVLLTHTPQDPGTARRLKAALAATGGTAIAVLVGAWRHGATWEITATGHAYDGTQEQPATPRMCVLNAAAATDLLTVISQAQPHPGHNTPLTSAADPPPTRARVPRQTARGQAPTTPRHTTKQPLHLQILGDTTLKSHGQPVTIRRTAARQALVFLAVHSGGANSRDLTTAIWPGLPAHTVTARLYTTLSDLRKAVAAVSDVPLIEHAGDRYRLRRDHIEVDLWRFHAAVEHAATAVTARPAAWQTVINAYTGNLAAEHDWPWLNPPREALRRHVIDAYTALAATQPDPRRALSLLQDAIRVDPYNEDLHRRAIHALEALGHHAAAEDLFTTFNRRLTDAGMEHVIPEKEVRQPRAASSGQKH
ncbi:BTAD domain-containing putative transcriptional regulator [Micromonospora sp. ZYX-F-536]|uniref:BTAD domain-containing putative transcriptional regulator n=1 Tax=Micromonospora sp. ZYX-F-536 TaxID=3457629 RepID=UPI00404091BB